MPPTPESRREAHMEHRRIIDEACKTIRSTTWHKRNDAITKIFDLLYNEPHLCLYHRAQISGLLAKHGDDADVEVAEYAMESIDYAQDIIDDEDLQVGTNARQAIEDIILDARETLRFRCPDIQLPEDIMASVWSQPRPRTHDDSDEDDYDDEEEEGEEEEVTDADGDVDIEDEEDPDESEDEAPPTPTSTTSTDLMSLDMPPSPLTLQSRIHAHSTMTLPSNYELSSLPATNTSQFEDFAYELDPQHLPLAGLMLMLLLSDPRAMKVNVVAYARERGMREEEVGAMMARAYVPRRRDGDGVGVGGEVVLREGPPPEEAGD